MKYRLFGRDGITEREFQKLVDWGYIALKKWVLEDGEIMYKIEHEGIDKLDLSYHKFRYNGVESKYDLYVDNN